jgi:hypothetical protein
MKTILIIFIGLMFCINFYSCEKDEQNNNNNNQIGTFVSIESPYLICANRNPGGVGFDFVYHDSEGGANNMDSLSVSDFEYDVIIKVIKGEKPDGSLKGMPFIKLCGDSSDMTVGALNYSEIDTTCIGESGFNSLSYDDLPSLNFEYDSPDFTTDGLITGNTGKPLVSELNKQYAKLVIGDAWKATAHNPNIGDEIIWIIKTREGKLVKFVALLLQVMLILSGIYWNNLFLC